MKATAAFLSYLEYRADMARRYPGWSVLTFRDWLDFGSRA